MNRDMEHLNLLSLSHFAFGGFLFLVALAKRGQATFYRPNLLRHKGIGFMLPRSFRKSSLTLFLLLAAFNPPQSSQAADPPWTRHVVDDSSRGADGVRLKDVNGDGLPDITTGWEEGGVTRVYLHPGPAKVRSPWPRVTVGKTPSVEDAVFADLDGDGAVDVISSCEGKTRKIFVHWAPKKPEDYLDARRWTTEAVPAAADYTKWMFALPLRGDGRRGTDLVVGAKGDDALVGVLKAPRVPRNLDEWSLKKWAPAGWIMLLAAADVDADGDQDVVFSDRKRAARGIYWLENPGDSSSDTTWNRHPLGAIDREVMFLDIADLDADGTDEVVVAVRPDEIHVLSPTAEPTSPWGNQTIRPEYPDGLGTAKGVCVGDLDRDGRLDLVYSCEHAHPPKRGVAWLHNCPSKEGGSWKTRDISGPEGIKFDRIELIDLDSDGDLDVLTCEERHNGRGLGIIWYENQLSR